MPELPQEMSAAVFLLIALAALVALIPLIVWTVFRARSTVRPSLHPSASQLFSPQPFSPHPAVHARREAPEEARRVRT